MDYIDLRLGDFLDNFVQMTDIVVYEISNTETLLFHARIGGGGLRTFDIEDSTIPPNGMSLNDYGVLYVSSGDRGLEIGVVEV